MVQPNTDENPMPPNRPWNTLDKIIEKFPKPPVDFVIPTISYLCVAIILVFVYAFTLIFGQKDHSNVVMFTLIGSTVIYILVCNIYYFVYRMKVPN
ncbi:uncharacterized protein BTUAT1_25470 [Bacillus altitudinis]|nr:uncharacterized protein BTUAT1_25470 [Bacillus pumilus]